ncbi:hypothetical protein CORC01_00001 [Colletotrichum orchidophilum]|uniref:Uncharacterized protein n=1 Tax=Colletotrichum orchidophilum TaxID=1209926 RepID=A0A1G4BSZ5_9PEZI|nr:uncharacterized protein CORC01_00001 [Colletotrichum orchidophilum]OHF04530.1 hypothetical protein CORC01_00001 [Colletotrichum orchidophilum]
MTQNFYFDTVTTPNIFHRERQRKENWLESLNEGSASNWGRDQLSALRVLAVNNRNHLPSNSAFWKDHDDARTALESLIQGPELSDRVKDVPCSEYALQETYGKSLGPIWAAMNRLCRTGDAQPKDQHVNSYDAGDKLAGDGSSMPSSPPPQLTPDPEKKQGTPLYSSPESLPT